MQMSFTLLLLHNTHTHRCGACSGMHNSRTDRIPLSSSYQMYPCTPLLYISHCFTPFRGQIVKIDWWQPQWLSTRCIWDFWRKMDVHTEHKFVRIPDRHQLSCLKSLNVEYTHTSWGNYMVRGDATKIDSGTTWDFINSASRETELDLFAPIFLFILMASPFGKLWKQNKNKQQKHNCTLQQQQRKWLRVKATFCINVACSHHCLCLLQLAEWSRPSRNMYYTGVHSNNKKNSAAAAAAALFVSVMPLQVHMHSAS